MTGGAILTEAVPERSVHRLANALCTAAAGWRDELNNVFLFREKRAAPHLPAEQWEQQV